MGEERRVDPRTGVIYVKENESGSLIVARPLGASQLRQINAGTWITWDSHRWPGETESRP